MNEQVNKSTSQQENRKSGKEKKWEENDNKVCTTGKEKWEG